MANNEGVATSFTQQTVSPSQNPLSVVPRWDEVDSKQVDSETQLVKVEYTE